MEVITKNKSSIYGKPKILFLSHSKDLEKYLSKISNEIFSIIPSVIYYSINNELTKDEIDSFSQFQMCVVPITKNFLINSDDSFNYFKTIRKLNIPILPLLEEDGLIEMFNKKCGDIQYLSRLEIDKTKISYLDKLTSFLYDVLVNEELTSKIKSCFDAYIFLSYRKKDRKFALELMNLIHDNKFTENIAIWYDEFLTPGENFNDAIKSMLTKSDLFAMVVTPNLVKEENYIQKIEYPLAINSNKHILPFELVETSYPLLKDHFKGINEPINPRIKEELISNLQNVFKNISIKEKNNTPTHDFFIGLAYFYGIDVEINRTKGLKLIKKAGESNLPEALLKLVNIYKYGDHVKINLNNSNQYLEKLVKVYKNRIESNSTLDDTYLYYKYSLELSNSLSLIYKINQSITLLHNIINELKLIENPTKDKRFDELLISAYQSLIESYSKNNDEDNVNKYIELTNNLIKSKSSDNDFINFNIAKNIISNSDIFESDKIDSTIDDSNYLIAYNLLNELRLKNNNNMDYYYQYAKCCLLLGVYYLRKDGKYQKYFTFARLFSTYVNNELDSLETNLLICKVNYYYSIMYKKLLLHDKAIDKGLESEKLLNSLFEKYKSSDIEALKEKNYYNLYDLYNHLKNKKKTKLYLSLYREAMSEFKKMKENEQKIKYRNNLKIAKRNNKKFKTIESTLSLAEAYHDYSYYSKDSQSDLEKSYAIFNTVDISFYNKKILLKFSRLTRQLIHQKYFDKETSINKLNTLINIISNYDPISNIEKIELNSLKFTLKDVINNDYSSFIDMNPEEIFNLKIKL